MAFFRSGIGGQLQASLIAFAHRRGSRWVFGLLFVVAVAAIAHSAFSWMGFNPTDDGFILAYSRRLLDGEVPYLDFISIHAIGSPLLHLPFVFFGGDYTFWISRFFVWFELALTAWAWTEVCAHFVAPKMARIAKFSYAGIGFLFSSHYFPIMAWNTIDGLVFISLGLLICTSESKNRRDLGYLVIGIAYLCKQNFLPAAPLALWLCGDLYRRRSWLAAALPGILFVVFLAVAGALPDAVLQLTARNELLDVGVLRYVWEYAFPWGILFGLIIGRLAYDEGRSLPILALYSVLIVAAVALGEGRFLWAPSFGLMGVTLGVGLNLWHRELGAGRLWRVALMAVTIGWCASISMGYNSPALATGLFIVFLLSLQHRIPVSPPFLVPVLTAILLVVSAVNYWQARHKYVYLDADSARLTEDAGALLPGLENIRTGPNTANFLRDLQHAVELVGERPYAIIPDLAAYWVRSSAPNPLPIDWPLGDILIREELIERVDNSFNGGDGRRVVIVQKIRANALSRGYLALPDSQRYIVATKARSRLRKIGETKFFELYE